MFQDQVPILPPGVVTAPPGKVGAPCRTGFDCRNGTCCRKGKDGNRTCRRLRKEDERCLDSAIKGGVYELHCPCFPGLECSRESIHRCHKVSQPSVYPPYTEDLEHTL
ncbi:secreted protein, putative [Ixodes scapularis]|uniref:Secreted protein, putative n=1 Tax=Ixodes scapularis TaxID=6945 RepID=B7P383_IXOSC|nr:secreted protein, putative [Ixodes scapularis]|eukprot:XP_002403691.1 secreted protein, putative [Ixodes scapularis]